MKIYVDERQRYEDTRSTAWSFTFVSTVGFILIVLLWLDIIPINIEFANKIMISVVMGIMFAIFLLVGIKSFMSLKNISKKADEQSNRFVEISEWFIEEYKDQMMVQFDSFENDEQDLYFQRFQFIFDTVKNKYSDLSEEDADHISEEIYNQIYSEK